MTDQALEALKESIAHWERLANGTQRAGESIFSDDCSLCGLFSQESDNSESLECFGCPVYQHTLRHGCRGTPWCEVADTLDEEFPETSIGGEMFRKAAAKQLKFLKSLLPKEVKCQ